MEQAKSILPRLFQGTPESASWDLDLIKAFWPEAVGPLLARHSVPVRVETPRLVVEVSDLDWRQEFEPMRGQIISLLQQELGSADVCDLRFELKQAAGAAGPRGRSSRRFAGRPGARRRKP